MPRKKHAMIQSSTEIQCLCSDYKNMLSQITLGNPRFHEGLHNLDSSWEEGALFESEKENKFITSPTMDLDSWTDIYFVVVVFLPYPLDVLMIVPVFQAAPAEPYASSYAHHSYIIRHIH